MTDLVHSDPLPAEKQSGQPASVQLRDVTFHVPSMGVITVPSVQQTNEEIEVILKEHGSIRITNTMSGQVTTIYRDHLAAIISVPSALASPNEGKAE